jgi:thymidylate kinase
LVGLDGAGKTTVARNLCSPIHVAGEFAGVRYFHWRPKVRRVTEWPLPDYRETPRKPPLPRTPLNTALSLARITRNVLLVRLAWIVQVRPLVRQGYLVIVDRYYYNYHLDPDSVRCSAPPGWVRFMTRLFPAPDLVIKLGATKEVLLARKGELTSGEVEAQCARLTALPAGPAQVVTVDSAQPPEAVAGQVRAEILRTRAGG